jgi:putative ABC transport system permease protein
MNIFEALRTALLDLALHKFRSALATIGIILGVASVEAMVSISEGAKQETLARIAVLGVDNVYIRSVKPSQTEVNNMDQQQRWQAEYGLLRRDIDHLRQEFPHIRYVVGLKNTRKKLYAPNGKQIDVSIVATEPDHLHITRSKIPRGRFISHMDMETRAQVCVVGAAAARKVFSWQDPLDDWIRVGNDWYKVVGILENEAGLRDVGGEDLNNFIFIPLATAQSRYGDQTSSQGMGSYEQAIIQLDQIAIQLEHEDLVVPTAQRMEAYLTKTHKLKDYQLQIPLELMRQKVATQRIWTIVMVVIASISLIVGGVGIMNIMLANVTDRRKEIGTRRALGARRRDIMRQFVFEAATLTGLGGLAGAALGYALAKSVSKYADWPTIITPESIILSLGVSILVGLIFGLWPASQAAKVSPIEALRSE